MQKWLNSTTNCEREANNINAASTFLWICFVAFNKSETNDRDPLIHSSIVYKDVILHINDTHTLPQLNPGSVPVTPLSPLTFQAQRILQVDKVSQWVISGTATSSFPTLSTSLEILQEQWVTQSSSSTILLKFCWASSCETLTTPPPPPPKKKKKKKKKKKT